MVNNLDTKYTDLLQDILDNGNNKGDRRIFIIKNKYGNIQNNKFN
jgi:hypothetical protein